jgi:hypothetical protein
MLQLTRPLRVGHTTPPCTASTVITRLRRFTPEPQDSEHTDHAVHGDTTQSTGHCCAWHDWVLDSAGQATPPKFADTCTLLCLVWDPPPQVLEQAFQVPHEDTTQSIGQCWVWQARLSLLDGQATPPSETAVVTLRVRAWLPVPQVTEHADQLLKSLMTQSTGQLCELQSWDCCKSGQT